MDILKQIVIYFKSCRAINNPIILWWICLFKLVHAHCVIIIWLSNTVLMHWTMVFYIKDFHLILCSFSKEGVPEKERFVNLLTSWPSWPYFRTSNYRNFSGGSLEIAFNMIWKIKNLLTADLCKCECFESMNSVWIWM